MSVLVADAVVPFALDGKFNRLFADLEANPLTIPALL
jgi:hypothetical protein